MERNHKIERKKAEYLVQKKLWRFNYSVERITAPKDGCDLLVDGHIKIEVKSTMMRDKGCWLFTLDRLYTTTQADVYALVFWYPDEASQVRFIKTEDLRKITKDTTAIRQTERSRMKKSYKILGRPQYLAERPVKRLELDSF